MLSTCSEAVQALIDGQATGMTAKAFKAAIAQPLSNHLPPHAEQHRIVAKVDAFGALCDQLQVSFTTTATTFRTLLDGLLAEALSQQDVAMTETVQ